MVLAFIEVVYAIARLRILGSIDLKAKALTDTTTFCAIESPVKKILKHLGLWDQKARPPPKLRPAAERAETLKDDSFFQVPTYDNYFYMDSVYPDIYLS